MKKLLFAAFLAPSIASAEVLSSGCFVADDNPGSCYIGTATPHDFGSYQMNSFVYGSVVARLQDDIVFINQLAEANGRAYDQCAAAYSSCNSDFSTLANSCAANEANRQEWIAYGNTLTATVAANKKLIKKLRKACGAKCKRIR